MSARGDDARARLLALPIRRPVAVSMLFVGLCLLGLIAWWQIPVELFPRVSGDELTVSFSRPGSEPEIVERDLLLPLEARLSTLGGVAETWATVRGSGGSMRIRFERGVDLGMRELEVQRLASSLAREQPPGTSLSVQAFDTSLLSRFAMVVHLTSPGTGGGADADSLHDLADLTVVPRIASLPGVSQVLISGGAAREVTAWIDPDRAAAVGVAVEEVTAAVGRAVGGVSFLGGVEDEAGRSAVVLDARPAGLVSLGRTRVRSGLPVELRHVVRFEVGSGRQEQIFRVDGRRSVGLVIFQDEGANLVRLGRRLRQRLDELRDEIEPLGLGLAVGFDAAEQIEDQLSRLARLGLSGFLVGLAVLYLFLRQWRAVAVVGVAVPVSLLVALAALYLGGQSLNLISLFGLALGIGLLVDNSVVVYEAVQRRLERGADPDGAAIDGVRRTVRAILAASATTAVVFLPAALVDLGNAVVQSLLGILALSILLPLAASLLVAVGLVPLLAHRLAAPAALRRIAEEQQARLEAGGRVPPDRVRGVFSGLVATSLRHPSGWVAGVAAAVILTLIFGLPILLGSSLAGAMAPQDVDQLRLVVRLDDPRSLDSTEEIFAKLERAALALDGVERVESLIQEDGGSLTVSLVERSRRPAGLTAGRVRGEVGRAAEGLDGVAVLRPEEADSSQGGGNPLAAVLGQAAPQIVLSGPDSRRLEALAADLRERLEALPEVDSAWLGTQRGSAELQVSPSPTALASFGLVPDEILPLLRIVGREGIQMRAGLVLQDGRELPLTVRRPDDEAPAAVELAALRLDTDAGTLPLAALTEVRQMPPPTVLRHHNGRRELQVFYRLEDYVPASGAARIAAEEQVAATVRSLQAPGDTVIELVTNEQETSWFRRILVPVLLLLLLVLAMTFESVTLPLLVLLALPLTLLGTVWALVLSGTRLEAMALMGALALIGLTVNPAILLVDRMQQRVLGGGWPAGAAALAAVRERARPVLMTTATTVAGLWPLALSSGRENEIWPPFAITVMGGLVTSTLLTLLVIPFGFVFLRRLDELFGRLGPWVLIGWVAATAALIAGLVTSGLITSLLWQVITTLLVAGLLLGLAVRIAPRPAPPEPTASDGRPPMLEARFLRKVYGIPGAVGKAWRAPQLYAERVAAAGGRPFHPRMARRRFVPLVLVAAGMLYLAISVSASFWRLIYLLAAAALLGALVRQIGRARGRVDRLGRALTGGPEGVVVALMPWAALLFALWFWRFRPLATGDPAELGIALVVFFGVVAFFVQLGRRTARRVALGVVPAAPTRGPLRTVRALWRGVARRLFGFDLPREEVEALAGVSFAIDHGMVGVLGPNGAGKSTLLRLLAGILDPTRGRIFLGEVRLEAIRRRLARWVGYLPQDASLPDNLTAREYLDYYALLYGLEPETRRRRVDDLLTEVGLGERADERIGGFSGGMRQRVAVARTLLRLPPVIIVDEPTVGLDPRERIRFRNLLSRLARGRVVLFSTHVVEDVAVACDRVLVLAGGELVFDGEPSALADRARGRVWELSLPAGEAAAVVGEGVRVVDEVPEEGERSRLRILASGSPHPAARPVEPRLEEGYLALVGHAAAAEAVLGEGPGAT